MRLCLYGCEKPMIGTTGFCGKDHAEKYLKRALDERFRSGSGVGSTVEFLATAKDELEAIRKDFREKNPGKQWRYR